MGVQPPRLFGRIVASSQGGFTPRPQKVCADTLGCIDIDFHFLIDGLEWASNPIGWGLPSYLVGITILWGGDYHLIWSGLPSYGVSYRADELTELCKGWCFVRRKWAALYICIHVIHTTYIRFK